MTSGRVIVNLEEVTNSCFVAMPFHPLYDEEHRRVIKPAELKPAEGNKALIGKAVLRLGTRDVTFTRSID